ncbi:MAG: hypothetical protein IPJ69_05620 [Deltaproteobacteria bacterium]|nr:MAG: hypothetical protein IPJ69_05620 [Deltaproteobacteria bacterium]
MISKEFKNALKTYPEHKYQIAWKAGISPGVLNHLINGHQKVPIGDERLLRIAELIRFPTNKVFLTSQEE